jgi:hypothetical protein
MIEYHIVAMSIQAALLTLQNCLEQDEHLLLTEAFDDDEAKRARNRVRKMKRFTTELTEVLEGVEREISKEVEA